MITRHAGGIRPGGFFSSPAPWWGLFLPAKTASAVVFRCDGNPRRAGDPEKDARSRFDNHWFDA
jgi:hypothetical protein